MSETKKAGLFILKVQFLIFYLFSCLPVAAQTTSQPVISVVQTPDNTNQWTGIANRLQATGVKYCVIPLESVKTSADFGNRPVLFLPNVETLTPAQALDLEEWMSKGGAGDCQWSFWESVSTRSASVVANIGRRVLGL